MEVPSTKAVGSFDDGLRQFVGVTHELAFVFVMWSILELMSRGEVAVELLLVPFLGGPSLFG
ncbi:hypothetical protein F2Q70_00021496 [Brassica cretica]|uniref:Uncharacterized protein n=1 Tax=Brassica cretica TaxID=69181 RepID=A0A8S9GUN3_BRACR|nr:hypothetical protein F2Q70_00021496 [Brassica cretica]